VATRRAGGGGGLNRFGPASWGAADAGLKLLELLRADPHGPERPPKPPASRAGGGVRGEGHPAALAGKRRWVTNGPAMGEVRCEHHSAGILLPELGLWLDAREARKGPERVFISHAHADHVARHREVIVSEATGELLGARLPGRRVEHRLAWGRAREFEGPTGRWRITLQPAGHILGSAMALLEADGASLLYTGDFKLRAGKAAESCVTTPADTLIMETTFGLPRYRFPPADEVFLQVTGFCRETLQAGRTPVLLGYSLGKSQEILFRLGDAGFRLVVHPEIARMTEVYRRCGLQVPEFAVLGQGGGGTTGAVVICPPGTLRGSGGPAEEFTRTAVLTGWALDSDCRYRYRCDAAFPLSDHADFEELLELVRRVEPRRVLTVHGFAVEFAATLRRQGCDARALGREEQLEFVLG